jgi:sugar phosphate isomerase/epimerase
MTSHSNLLSRRTFTKGIITAAGAAITGSRVGFGQTATPAHAIRLGGPVHVKYTDPEAWVAAVKDLGYSAAYCPVNAKVGDDEIKAYERAAQRANIIIAEVGAWSNPISPDTQERKAAIEKCQRQLDLADRIGARCCVNVSGSRGEQWAGPSEKNLTQETFDMIVETTRSIIDKVQPIRSFFTLETMPWAYPDSADSYLGLLKAIDRKRFAVHLDPVNLVCSPQRYFSTGKLIRECFAKLGPYIKSCHAKDIILSNKLTTHLDEIRPGLGGLDYTVFLHEVSKRKDLPLMLEHLSGAKEYKLAADHVRAVAKREGLVVQSS